MCWYIYVFFSFDMSSTAADHDARARVIEENYKKLVEYYNMGGRTWLGSLLKSMGAVIKANFDKTNNSEDRKKVMEDFHKLISDPRFDDVVARDKPIAAVLSFGRMFGAAFEDMIDRTNHGSMLFEPATIPPFEVKFDGWRKRRHVSPSTSSDMPTTSSNSSKVRTRPVSGAKAHRTVAISKRGPPATGPVNYLQKPPPGHPIYSLPVTDFTFPRLITDPQLMRRSRNGTPPNEMNQQYDPMLAQPFLKTGRPMFNSMLDSDDSPRPPPKPKARAEKKTALKTPKQEVMTPPRAKRTMPKMVAMKSVKKEDSISEETVREWAVDCFDKQAVCFICDKMCPNYLSVSNHLYHQHKGVCQQHYIFQCDGCNKHWSSFRGALGHVRTAIRMNGIGCKNKMTYVWEQRKNEEMRSYLDELEDIEDEEEEEGERRDEEEGRPMVVDANEDDEPVIKEEVDHEEKEDEEQRAPEM